MQDFLTSYYFLLSHLIHTIVVIGNKGRYKDGTAKQNKCSPRGHFVTQTSVQKRQLQSFSEKQNTPRKQGIWSFCRYLLPSRQMIYRGLEKGEIWMSDIPMAGYSRSELMARVVGVRNYRLREITQAFSTKINYPTLRHFC